MTSRNIWIKIGLSPLEMAAVRKIRASNSKPRQVNLSNIIRTLVINSLAHYDSMLRLLTVDQDYARTEGFMGTEYYQEEIIKKAFGLKQTGISKWA